MGGLHVKCYCCFYSTVTIFCALMCNFYTAVMYYSYVHYMAKYYGMNLWSIVWSGLNIKVSHKGESDWMLEM